MAALVTQGNPDVRRSTNNHAMAYGCEVIRYVFVKQSIMRWPMDCAEVLAQKAYWRKKIRDGKACTAACCHRYLKPWPFS